MIIDDLRVASDEWRMTMNIFKLTGHFISSYFNSAVKILNHLKPWYYTLSAVVSTNCFQPMVEKRVYCDVSKTTDFSNLK